MKVFWRKAEVAPEQAEAAHAAPRGRVLVVEDDATTRQLVSRLLTREGYEVVTAADGADALIEANRQLPDALILDLMLPSSDPASSQLDGFGVLQWLQSRIKIVIPTIVLTCRQDEEARRMADSLRVARYLTKPFRTQELVTAVESLVDLQPFSPSSPCPVERA
jgi:DNA-binding response OmpR family regulator